MQIIVEDGGVSGCTLVQYDCRRQGFVALAHYDRRPAAHPRIPVLVPPAISSPEFRKALAIGEPIIVQRDQIGSEGKTAQIISPSPFTSICILPLIPEPDLQLVVVVGEEREWDRAPFTTNRVRRLELAGIQIGGACARMHWQERAHWSEIGHLLCSSLEIDTLIERLSQQMIHAISAEQYCLGVCSPDGANLNVELFADGRTRQSTLRVPLLEGRLGRIVATGASILISDNTAEEIWNLPETVLDWSSFSSWVGVPVGGPDSIVAVLAAASCRPNAYEASDQDVLEKIARQAADGLTNALRHRQLEQQAHRDSLTQVLNHSFFLVRLEQEFKRARESNGTLSLIIVDIDYFKSFNDECGHLAGDNTLCTVAEVIRCHLNHSDIVGRWGGDEFVIALPGAGIHAAELVARRIQRTLAEAWLVGNQRRNMRSLTVCQGISTLDPKTENPLVLIDTADRALYQAKLRGRDRIEMLG